jgi:uncharacterized protein (DUF1499 family)
MNNRLKPCPDKPNCVSSLSNNAMHSVAPIAYDGDWQMMKATLIELIENTPRAEIVENTDEYLHACFKSKLFGFVDDVEFVFYDAQKLIHIRSASRLGYYDFGVNRRRVRWLREALAGIPSS